MVERSVDSLLFRGIPSSDLDLDITIVDANGIRIQVAVGGRSSRFAGSDVEGREMQWAHDLVVLDEAFAQIGLDVGA